MIKIVTYQKCFLILLFCIFILSCGLFKNDEVEYLEKISGVPFPKELVIYETFDNAEYILGGVFQLKKENLSYFESKLKFEIISQDTTGKITIDYYQFHNSWLQDTLNNFNPKNSMIIWTDCRMGNQITFCIDTINLKMWCESWYPDNSGDSPCGKDGN